MSTQPFLSLNILAGGRGQGWGILDPGPRSVNPESTTSPGGIAIGPEGS